MAAELWEKIKYFIISRLYEVGQPVFAHTAGNPADTKSSHLITHVNHITSNEVIEDIFD